MPLSHLLPFSLLLIAALCSAEPLDKDAPREALASDDECAVVGVQCGLNALQMKAKEQMQLAMDLSEEDSPDPSKKDSPCLCLFDIDRTMTAKQHKASECPGTTDHPKIHDSAYGGGPFVASEVGSSGLNKTACKDCYVGIVTHGDVSGDGSAERAYYEEHTFITAPQLSLYEKLGWSTGSIPWIKGSGQVFKTTSPFIVLQPDGLKQQAAKGIVSWFGTVGIDFALSDVYFFDDRSTNVAPFAGTGMNAQEISCASRSGPLGFCGATLAEIAKKSGVHLCEPEAKHRWRG